LTHHKCDHIMPNMERKHQYMGIKLPADVKRQIRLLAARNETSIAEMSLRLLESGLGEYLKLHESGEAQELRQYMQAQP
jgi:hypothetical protein